MSVVVNLYSQKNGEIKNFLYSFYDTIIDFEDTLKWEKAFNNPIDLADILGTLIENNDKYSINMWINLDDDFFINVNNDNADKIIRYLFERYPY